MKKEEEALGATFEFLITEVLKRDPFIREMDWFTSALGDFEDAVRAHERSLTE